MDPEEEDSHDAEFGRDLWRGDIANKSYQNDKKGAWRPERSW